MPRKSTTRAAQGSGTIRQRKDGRWEARYTVGRNPGNGKQVQRSVYGDTQKEVRKALSEAVSALDTGNYFEPSKMTLGEEFIYVLRGRMEISYGKNTYLLEEGDSIYYDSIVPHHVHGYQGEAAQILAVVYTPA